MYTGDHHLSYFFIVELYLPENRFFHFKNKGGTMPTNVLSKKVERFPSLFEDFFRPWNEFVKPVEDWRKGITVPSVNISETPDSYTVSMAAPGLKKEDFNISLEGNMLTISCEKEEGTEQEEKEYNRREYSYSSFSRSFSLPDGINLERILAIYENGILKLDLPKKEEVKRFAASKQIAVK
jgi:HSP20 family protein